MYKVQKGVVVLMAEGSRYLAVTLFRETWKDRAIESTEWRAQMFKRKGLITQTWAVRAAYLVTLLSLLLPRWTQDAGSSRPS